MALEYLHGDLTSMMCECAISTKEELTAMHQHRQYTWPLLALFIDTALHHEYVRLMINVFQTTCNSGCPPI